jgi:hypothetical protein
MNNSDLFQAIINQTDAIVGTDSTKDGSIGLFHVLACALDWCDEKGVDFEATLQEVRDHFAEQA